jgi:hypothetical protein
VKTCSFCCLRKRTCAIITLVSPLSVLIHSWVSRSGLSLNKSMAFNIPTPDPTFLQDLPSWIKILEHANMASIDSPVIPGGLFQRLPDEILLHIIDIPSPGISRTSFDCYAIAERHKKLITCLSPILASHRWFPVWRDRSFHGSAREQEVSIAAIPNPLQVSLKNIPLRCQKQPRTVQNADEFPLSAWYVSFF